MPLIDNIRKPENRKNSTFGGKVVDEDPKCVSPQLQVNQDEATLGFDKIESFSKLS